MNGILRTRGTALWRRVVYPEAAMRSMRGVSQVSANKLFHYRGPSSYATHKIDASDPSMFHRTIIGRLRDGNKIATRKLRREQERIPGFLEGRGKIPDLLLEIPCAPLFEDFRSGRFALQKRGKTKFMGPLYELRIEPGTVDEYGNLLDTSNIPFERIRVLVHNMEIHRLTERPLSVSLRYSPENERVRVRVPIRCINEEKSKGLREGGWLNQLHWYIDINVAPYMNAPPYATMDVGDMDMKDKRKVGDLQYEGKGKGCRAILPEHINTTMISPM